jgi:hypothetical protein
MIEASDDTYHYDRGIVYYGYIVVGNVIEPEPTGKGMSLSTLVVLPSWSSGDGFWDRLV